MKMETKKEQGYYIRQNKELGQNRSCPDSSVGKESACNAGDTGLIPGSGRSTGEGIGYPFQYSWASLVAELVKNPPAMRETWVRSLGWKDPLEKGKPTHSSVLAWRIPWTSPFPKKGLPWWHPKERQCQRMFKLLHTCTHLTC